jgi:hypothetical protein
MGRKTGETKMGETRMVVAALQKTKVSAVSLQTAFAALTALAPWQPQQRRASASLSAELAATG